ncbi:hypothetical protein GON26_19270 [Flavobacterium sp. GA093]|uniref:Uncharacterized protein n=1 Tax=Flavobacterium hydrocarbonoxydans TaxID=2683249 RepID=A0A6I4NQI6_9FLAO|nr:hypothetical protein [Flavobacterium hydrocarbonoxydans]MWB96510.1 hypothetical protein [Flavobacterium hydrocarbonoxydans]
MKKLFVLMILIGFNMNAQNTEFKVYDNGLIYSENSVTKLKHIVDSLNLKFKVCEFNKTFLSYPQSKANFIRLDKKDVLKAKKDLENNISYSEFKAKYPKATFEENLMILKSNYTNYDNIENVKFSSLELGGNSNESITTTKQDADSYKNIFKGKWLFQYDEKTSYSNESLTAFYFIEEFKTKPIADKYARLIQYSDCLVDTTAQIFYDNAKDTGVRYLDTVPTKALKFQEYVDKVLKKPSFSDEKLNIIWGYDEMAFDKKSKKKNKKNIIDKELAEREFELFRKNLENWESLKFTRCDSLRRADSNFSLMLDEALAEAKVNKSSDDEFEEYVGRYISKDAELELKRNRRVIGGCSMDNSPRVHALNIAMLSAETIKWEIFLRSHLNIMNDRFDRASDGSYAQKERNTYIKEIEVLDINVLDLILGISLRIENPSKNHYFSSINRVGRALAESSNPKLVETTILDMIADNDLDDYNRVLMYYLFDNYNYNLTDVNAKNLNQTKLQLAVSKMPDYISSRIITRK